MTTTQPAGANPAPGAATQGSDGLVRRGAGLIDVILYRSDDGAVQLDVQLERETVWLNQRQMAELFDKDTDIIGLHVRNIYK
jgi:hypothetical protein